MKNCAENQNSDASTKEETIFWTFDKNWANHEPAEAAMYSDSTLTQRKRATKSGQTRWSEPSSQWREGSLDRLSATSISVNDPVRESLTECLSHRSCEGIDDRVSQPSIL